MKLVKKASGKTTIKMSKSEWQSIGIKAGWLGSKSELTYKQWLSVGQKIASSNKKFVVKTASSKLLFTRKDWVDFGKKAGFWEKVKSKVAGLAERLLGQGPEAKRLQRELEAQVESGNTNFNDLEKRYNLQSGQLSSLQQELQETSGKLEGYQQQDQAKKNETNYLEGDWIYDVLNSGVVDKGFMNSQTAFHYAKGYFKQTPRRQQIIKSLNDLMRNASYMIAGTDEGVTDSSKYGYTLVKDLEIISNSSPVLMSPVDSSEYIFNNDRFLQGLLRTNQEAEYSDPDRYEEKRAELKKQAQLVSRYSYDLLAKFEEGNKIWSQIEAAGPKGKQQ